MCKPRLPRIEGQAVFEGVLMRTSCAYAIAIRRPSGEIVVRQRPMVGFVRPGTALHAMSSLPFIRGLVAIGEGALCALEAASFSAEQAGLGGPLARAALDAPSDLNTKRPAGTLALSLLLAAVLAAGLFVALPHACAHCFGRLIGAHWAASSWQLGAAIGGFKLTFLLAYLGSLGTLQDIRRLFMYHGAEHKVISIFEAQQPLTLLRARDAPVQRAHCGVAFLLVVLVVAIMLFSVALPVLLSAMGGGLRSHGLLMVVKTICLLPTMAATYEANRWLGRHAPTVLLWPCAVLQGLTLRQPQDEMIEVAIVALKAVLAHDEKTQEAGPYTHVFRSFADAAVRQGL